MRTYSPKAGDAVRKWHVIDAQDVVLGRLATHAAVLLRGKHKATFAPHMDSGDHVVIINADKIEHVEAQDDYVQIRSEGKSYLKNQRMSELEEQLDAEQFLRIHRSYIVNIAFVDRIEQATKDSHVAILKDGSRVPISRSGYQKVRELIR